MPFVVAFKLPAFVSDVALTGLIYHVLCGAAPPGDAPPGGRGHAWAAYVALLYALNPVSLLVSSYHGQFEAVTLLLLVVALWLWQRQRAGASAAALGLAILNKTWPVLLLPVIFLRLSTWLARLLYSLIA